METFINILKIPFYTKGEMKKEYQIDPNNNLYKIKGNIFYYVTNFGHLIYKSSEVLKGSEYRKNDCNLVAAVGYLKNGQYAEKYEDYKFNSIFEWRMNNFKPTYTMKEVQDDITVFLNNNKIKDHSVQSMVVKLNSVELEHINKMLKDNQLIKTPLSLIGLLQGSNASGSIKNHKANPLLISEGKYKYYNFTQAFGGNKFNKKTILIKNKNEINKIIKISDDKLEIINIETFLDSQNIDIKKQFLMYNKSVLSDNELEIIEKDDWSEYLIKYSKEVKYNDDEFLESLSTFTSIYKKNKMDIKVFKSKLRNIYINRVNAYISKNKIESFFMYGYIPEFPEKCHIVSFSYLVKNKRYKDAVDYLNHVPFDPTLHRGFDNGDYYIKHNGDVVNTKSKEVKLKMSPNFLKNSNKYVVEALKLLNEFKKPTSKLGR